MNKHHKILLFLALFTIIFLISVFLFSHFSSILNPGLGMAHAQDLHTDLVAGQGSQLWIFSVWKVALALANVIVIVMLLFVAIVNIVHLQYDTYAIKKSLPLLIIGIIMANFSLLICRMIVDAAQVLANTFAGDPSGLAHDLLCSFGFMVNSRTIVLQLLVNPSGLIAGGFIITILVLLVIMLAVFILAFLLWIRKFVIFLLVAVAPVAFIMYAFPPTQGLFKQWWGWFLKWTFMGPIVMLLVWVASQIGASNCGVITTGGSNFSISGLFATAGVLYLAAIVPFKLGGGLMSAWGKFGQWATGTKKDGYLRKPTDASIQRKKDVVLGAGRTAWGNTTMGRWGDRGIKNEEGLIANYKNRREGQMTDREHEVRTRHADFAENEKALEQAKGRLDTTIKSQIGLYIQQHAGVIGQEALDAKNAAGDVDRETANAETLARGPIDSDHAIDQRLQEKEVEFAKTNLEENVQSTEALIREGAMANIPPGRLREIYGVDTLNENNDPTTGIDIKNRYLEQDNRLDNLKEQLSKEAGEDAQVLAERDLRRNSDIRQTTNDLHAGGALYVTSDYDLQGNHLHGGHENVSYAGALDAAEQLDYQATTTADENRRTELSAAAQHLREQAVQTRTNHQTYTQAMVVQSENQAIQSEAQANNSERQAQTEEAQAATERAAGNIPAAETHEAEARRHHQEQAEHTQTATQSMAAATYIRTRVGHDIEYGHVLSRNLSGRRQKKINPDISDEIHTAEITNSPAELIAGVRQGSFGTGRSRGNQQDAYNVLTGDIDRSSEAGARAAVVQIGAVHSVMKTARHGDAAGLASIQGFNDLMTDAGRGNFKVAAATNAINAMNPTLRANILQEAMRQRGITPTLDARGNPNPPMDTQWTALSPDRQAAALEGLDFSQLDVKSQANTGQRDFVDRYLTQIEEDPAMNLSSSPGSKLGRARGVDPNQRTENRPLTPSPIPAPTPTPSPMPTTPPAPRGRQNRRPLRGRQGPRPRHRPRP